MASSLPAKAVCARLPALVGHERNRALVEGAYQELPRPARRTAASPECLEVVRKNGPHGSDLDSIESLSQQQPAHIGLRCLELGRGLCDGEQAGALDRGILARARNHFLL
jgi:hypothetical protein